MSLSRTKDTTLVRALVFDMDGLLVETESIHIRTFQEWLSDRGVTLPPGYAHGLVGFSIAENIETIKRDFALAGDAAALGRERNERYLEMLRASQIAPLPGVAELFRFGDEQRLARAVCSSSERRQLEVVLPRVLGALGIESAPEEYFDAIMHGDMGLAAKPAPDLYVEAARRLGMAASECVAFEDSRVGVQAASAAGMRVVAVPNPFATGVEGWPADAVVASLGEALSSGILSAGGPGGARFAGLR